MLARICSAFVYFIKCFSATLPGESLRLVLSIFLCAAYRTSVKVLLFGRSDLLLLGVKSIYFWNMLRSGEVVKVTWPLDVELDSEVFFCTSFY